MKKLRQQILLEPEQKKRLQAESDYTGVPKTEIVRRALDAYLSNSNISHNAIKAYMDDISRKAAERGLTPEKLEKILNA